MFLGSSCCNIAENSTFARPLDFACRLNPSFHAFAEACATETLGAYSFASHAVLPLFRFVAEHTTLSASNPDGAGSYETEFMGDGRKLSFPWRYSFSLNEIMYRYIGFGFILPYEATKQSSSINNCSIIPTESCWARS